MANISIDYGVFGGNFKFAIICRNKFEVTHCIKALYRDYPRVKAFGTIKRYASIAMSQGMPTAISPNLHRPGYGIGYCSPEYYIDDGYVVAEFSDLISKDIDESDTSIEDFLGLLGGNNGSDTP